MVPQAALGAADGFGLGEVTNFLDPMRADRFGMFQRPTIRPQRGQIALATQQAVKNVLHVPPDVQKVAVSRAHDRHQDRRAAAFATFRRRPIAALADKARTIFDTPAA